MSNIEHNAVKRLFDEQGNRSTRLRLAINAMCATCVGCTSKHQGDKFVDHMEGGYRTVIRECAVTSCPLHHVRPYQKK